MEWKNVTSQVNPAVSPRAELMQNGHMFTLKKTSTIGRQGIITTSHGEIPTPVFMPVATAGAMKGITFDDLQTLGTDILLCNTYHLHLAPGEEMVEQAGGLHAFIGWDKPILTDSGGFQVFSLEAIRKMHGGPARY